MKQPGIEFIRLNLTIGTTTADNQVFSPVVRFETVHLIISMAALENWHMHGLDVCNAYLYGELDEEIYMEQPEGFSVPGNTGHLLHL